MIHYSCDRCHRAIDAQQEIRFSMRIEIHAALDPLETDLESDREHLNELHAILERLEDSECEEISESAYQRRSYDLCPECHREFVKNPLAVETAKKLEFSDN